MSRPSSTTLILIVSLVTLGTLILPACVRAANPVGLGEVGRTRDSLPFPMNEAQRAAWYEQTQGPEPAPHALLMLLAFAALIVVLAAVVIYTERKPSA